MGALDETILTNKKSWIASNSYYHDVLTWCVQESHEIPEWQNIFHLCSDPMVWLLHTLMCISVICMGYFLQGFEKHRKLDWHSITLAGIGCLCGFSVQHRNVHNTSGRIFLGFCLYGSVVFNICLISCMINFLKKPLYEDQIDSIQQIINNSYELAGDEFALEHLVKQNGV